MQETSDHPLRQRLRGAWKPAFAFEFWATLIFAIAIAPTIGWLLNRLVARGGRYAVSDHDLVAFFLSAPGILFLLFGLGFVLAFWYAEQVGLLLILGPAPQARKVSVSRVLLENGKHVPALLRLGLIQGAMVLALCVPVLLGVWLAHRVFLSEFDLYYYVNVQPSEWWLAVASAGTLVLIAAVVAAWLYVRWIHAIPGIVFENLSAPRALQASWQLTAGKGMALGLPLVACWGVVLLAMWLANWLIASLATRLIGGTEAVGVLVPAVLGTLAVITLVDLLLFAVGKVVHVGVVATAYRETVGIMPPRVVGGAPEEALPPWAIRAGWIGAGVVLATLLIGGAVTVFGGLDDDRAIGITGHRGSKRRAPENTLSAIETAISEGADFAEIDVQTTADGVAVLLHDADLMRVAGDRRRLRDVAYAELADLDVGAWFDPRFRGERIPTLQEVIDAARGRIKLNIELKYTWADPALAGEVVRLVQENEFASDCVLSSLRFEALAEIEALNPELTTGFIVFQAVGNVANMEADFLSVSAARATPRFVRQAHRRGRQVHVWTVNDPGNALRMVETRVDNIITDEPRLIRGTIERWNELSRSERLVLILRGLLFDTEAPKPEEQ